MWAGNGSNEVLQHLVLAFAGPGRTALGFTPAYSMHPIISATMGTSWVDGLRGVGAPAQFDLTPQSAVSQVREHRPHVVFLCSPNNPTGTALPLPSSRRYSPRRQTRWSSSTRRMPSSPGPGRVPRLLCWPTTRCLWSPAR